MKNGMNYFAGKRILAAFLLVGLDLLMLAGRITGFDYMSNKRYLKTVLVIFFAAGMICIHCLDKRIEAQETEKLAKDLEENIDRMLLVVLIRAEGFIPRRLRRNKGDETRQQLPYENNIPRCLRRGMLIVAIIAFCILRLLMV